MKANEILTKCAFVRPLLTLTLLLTLTTTWRVTPARARWDGGTGTGPGGVGTTDGSGTLELWLMGNAGVYEDSSCTDSAEMEMMLPAGRIRAATVRMYTGTEPRRSLPISRVRAIHSRRLTLWGALIVKF